MKNFRRDQNVNGNPHIWWYEDNDGDLQIVACDVDGGIDVDVMLPDNNYKNANGFATLMISATNDVFDNIYHSGGWIDKDMGRVDGWQPKPNPMKVKP